MRNVLLIVVLLTALLPLAGCGKKEEPVTVENPPLTANNDTDPETATENVQVDEKFKLMVKGSLFFLTDQERKTLGMDGEAAQKALETMSPEEKRPKLQAILKTEPKGDLTFAASHFLATTPSDQEAYKQVLLEVPTDYARSKPVYDQAAEAWGDLAAEFYRETQDPDILTALYTHDLNGPAAEIINFARLDLIIDMPQDVLPKLNDVQLNNLGRFLDIASEDPEADVNTLIELSESGNRPVAQAAEKVLAAFESQQNSNQTESRVP